MQYKFHLEMGNEMYFVLIILCGSLIVFGCSEDTTEFEWQQIESNTDVHLYGVDFVDAKRGWAVGSAGTVLSTIDGGVSWTSSTLSKDTLTHVSFTTSNNGWIASIGKVHYTGSGGTTWSTQHQIRSRGKPPGILDIHFVNTTEGWVVGGRGTVLWTENGGGRWESLRNLSDKHLWSVHFADPEHGWIVGESGEVLHTQDGGVRWIRQKSGVEQPLFGVHFASLTHGWIVGTNGLILHTADSGRSWIRQQSLVRHNLRDVAFHDEQRGWAIGEKGLILRTMDGGNTWTRYPTPAQYNLQNIHLSKNMGWIVGAKGTVLRSY